jgi:hypothetical protein
LDGDLLNGVRAGPHFLQREIDKVIRHIHALNPDGSEFVGAPFTIIVKLA